MDRILIGIDFIEIKIKRYFNLNDLNEIINLC